MHFTVCHLFIFHAYACQVTNNIAHNAIWKVVVVLKYNQATVATLKSAASFNMH